MVVISLHHNCRLDTGKYYPVPLLSFTESLVMSVIGLMATGGSLVILGMLFIHHQKLVIGYQKIFSQFNWSDFLTTTSVLAFPVGIGLILLYHGVFRLYALYAQWREFRWRKAGYSHFGLHIGDNQISYRGFEDISLWHVLTGKQDNGLLLFPKDVQFSKEEWTGGMPGGMRQYRLRIDYLDNGVKKKKVLKDFDLHYHSVKRRNFVVQLNRIARSKK